MTSLILPAYNPGPAVEDTWHAVAAFIAERAARSDPWEAVFVLDGCTDDTPERLGRLAAARRSQFGGGNLPQVPPAPPSRLRIVKYGQNRGKGYAVRTGLLSARGAYRVFTDVDLAYSFDDVLQVAGALRAGAAVAIASRTHPDSRLVLPVACLSAARRRHFQSRVFGSAARMILPLTQRDTQAGLKGVAAFVAEQLVPELKCDGFGFDCELLTACNRAGLAVVEVPVTVRYESAATTTGTRAGLSMLLELWQIRRHWRNRSVTVALAPAVPGGPEHVAPMPVLAKAA
jgi:glycosyltransferase involved in cell wall biosynthesis